MASSALGAFAARTATVAALLLAAASPLAGCGKRSPAPPIQQPGADQGRAELQPLRESGSERLEREVHARLFGDPELSSAGSIVVIVDGSHVVLEGWVASATERTLAEADALTVAGVTSVDDRLLVRRRPPTRGGPPPALLPPDAASPDLSR